MKKITYSTLQNTSNIQHETALFLTFCRALEKHCDQIGISNMKFSAVRILHDAAYNTISGIQTVTPTHYKHMESMTKNIPEMLDTLIKITAEKGRVKTMEQMSEMCLADIAAIIAEKNHIR